MNKWLLLAGFLFFGITRVAAYDGIVVHNSEQIINISDKLRYQELDSDSLQYWANHLDATGRQKNILYRQLMTKNTIIAYLNLMNKIDEELFIQLGNPSIDHIILADITSEKPKIIYKGGRKHKKYIDNVRFSKYLIDLNSKGGGQKTYALIISDDKPLGDLEINLGTLKKYLDDRPEINLLEGMFFGIFLLLVLYNLFQYFTIKDPSYIYFGLYAASLTLLFAIIKGYTIEYFLGELPNFEMYVKILICTSGVLAVFFTATFLKTIINTPRRHIWLMALAVFYAISSIIFLFGGNEMASKIVYYNTLFTIFFVISISITMWKRSYKTSSPFLIAWLVLLLGMVGSTMVESEWIEYNLLTENLLQFSALIHIVLLSFALANKIRVYIDKKNEAQEIALQTAIENEKLITHQKQLLETKVFERTKDLEQSIEALKKQEEELQEANEFKDKVFSVISHDLKSPVSTLTGLLELLRLNTLSAEEKSNIIDNLDVALKNTKYLLDNILIWANPKLSKEKKKSDFNIFSVAEEVCQLFSIQAQAKKIELVNQINRNIKINTDKDVIRLVLRNLVSNALKFTPSGGRVELDLERQGNNVILKVSDNGIGIHPDQLKRLFENNHHHSTRGTHNEKGTGLGLILCNEFLEKNDHKISVKSTEGKGTTFYIELNSVLDKRKEKIPA